MTGAGRPVALLAVLAALSGCSDERTAEPPREARTPAAVVDGRPVPAEWVAAAARSEGLDAARALARTVEVAALAALARRQGLDRSPDLGPAARALRVRRLLETRAELSTPLSPADREDLRRLYRERETYFVHPEIRTVRHLAVVLGIPGGAAQPGRPPAPEPYWDAARRALESLRPLALGAASAQGFGALRQTLEIRFGELRPRLELGEAQVQVVSEEIGPFDLQGPYDPEFVRAAFALPAVGAVSEPVRTGFGWHLLYLAGIEPPREVPFEAAVPELLERGRVLLEQQRALRLQQAAVQAAGVRVHDERLVLTRRRQETPPP